MEKYISNIRQPLNLYSIFGYLLPGFFLVSLFIIDYDLSEILRLIDKNNQIKLKEMMALDLKIKYVITYFSSGTLSDFKFIPFLLFLLFCYFLGHIVSAFSSFVIERALVKWTIGYPSKVLCENSFSEFKYRWFFGFYRRPFKPKMQKKIKKSVQNCFKYIVELDDYYWLLYSYIITTRPYLAPRVHHFVNLYGFSRNVCATFIIYIIFRVTYLNFFANSGVDWAVITNLILFFLIGLIMFWNYLKLFKRQAVDIFFLFLSIRNGKDSIYKLQESNSLNKN